MRIIGKENCPFCEMLLLLVQKRNISHYYITANEEDREGFRKEGKTFPVVFIGSEYIGGYEEAKKYIMENH